MPPWSFPQFCLDTLTTMMINKIRNFNWTPPLWRWWSIRSSFLFWVVKERLWNPNNINKCLIFSHHKWTPKTCHKTLPSLIHLNFYRKNIRKCLTRSEFSPLWPQFEFWHTCRTCRQRNKVALPTFPPWLILIKFKPGKFELSLMNIFGWNSISVLLPLLVVKFYPLSCSKVYF